MDRLGFEDGGEIVSLATIEPLEHNFNEDLWKSGRPGKELGDDRIAPQRRE
jgi:hypothetical protein